MKNLRFYIPCCLGFVLGQYYPEIHLTSFISTVFVLFVIEYLVELLFC